MRSAPVRFMRWAFLWVRWVVLMALAIFRRPLDIEAQPVPEEPTEEVRIEPEIQPPSAPERVVLLLPPAPPTLELRTREPLRLPEAPVEWTAPEPELLPVEVIPVEVAPPAPVTLPEPEPVPVAAVPKAPVPPPAPIRTAVTASQDIQFSVIYVPGAGYGVPDGIALVPTRGYRSSEAEMGGGTPIEDRRRQSHQLRRRQRGYS